MVVISSALFTLLDKAPYSVRKPPILSYLIFCSFEAVVKASNIWQKRLLFGSPNLVTSGQ